MRIRELGYNDRVTALNAIMVTWATARSTTAVLGPTAYLWYCPPQTSVTYYCIIPGRSCGNAKQLHVLSLPVKQNEVMLSRDGPYAVEEQNLHEC
jgi:hypothetical protein